MRRERRMSNHATHPREADSETPALLAGYFARIDTGTLLTHSEEVDLSRRARSGDKRYRDNGLLFEDLIQEGNIGLMMSVDTVNTEKGFRFSTYATWWIRQT